MLIFVDSSAQAPRARLLLPSHSRVQVSYVHQGPNRPKAVTMTKAFAHAWSCSCIMLHPVCFWDCSNPSSTVTCFDLLCPCSIANRQTMQSSGSSSKTKASTKGLLTSFQKTTKTNILQTECYRPRPPCLR